MEQRIVSDAGADPRLRELRPWRPPVCDLILIRTHHSVRLSIGLEDFADLKADLIHGFNKVLEVSKENTIRTVKSWLPEIDH